jgi:Sec-independent protein translocase protein TatA
LLSPADLVVAFVGGLLLFGPEGLPQVARKAGKIVRELQSTSQSFVREMERAADIQEAQVARPPEVAFPPHLSGEEPPNDLGAADARRHVLGKSPNVLIPAPGIEEDQPHPKDLGSSESR